MYRFDMASVCIFVAEILKCLRAVHRTGYVHADLKPDNLVFGAGNAFEALQTLHLVDFGLSTKFLDKKINHASLSHSQGSSGTKYYMSRNTHIGFTKSRRDDIESLAYIAIELAKGKLPWNKREYNHMTES